MSTYYLEKTLAWKLAIARGEQGGNCSKYLDLSSYLHILILWFAGLLGECNRVSGGRGSPWKGQSWLSLWWRWVWIPKDDEESARQNGKERGRACPGRCPLRENAQRWDDTARSGNRLLSSIVWASSTRPESMRNWACLSYNRACVSCSGFQNSPWSWQQVEGFKWRNYTWSSLLIGYQHLCDSIP